MPTISVVIPAHDADRYISDAVSSVLDQTYQDFEVMIVDDGSTDRTPELISAFAANSRVRHIRQQNLGPSAARNTGIRASRGSFIAFLDADDFWQPDKLEAQLTIFESHPHVGVVYSDFAVLDDSGQHVQRTWRRPVPRGSLTADLMFGNVIAGSSSSVILRKECIESVGGFDQNLWVCEDQDLWRRLSMVCEFYFLEAVHVLVREHRLHLQGDPAKLLEGKLLYLDRMKSDTPTELRHFLPQAAYETYWDMARLSIRSGRARTAFRLLGKIPPLGIKYVAKLAYDFGVVLWRSVIRLPKWIVLDGPN